jgi:3D (Asp-Asp-Asp) domain-containing protein
MKRILHCLAALALSASAFGANAQDARAPDAQSPTATPPAAHSGGYDPIGDVLSAAIRSVEENASAWLLKATLYHGGAHIRGRDSLGCPVVAMRTVAVDPAIVSRRSIIFIKETAGMPLPGGGVHDGYWYASDVGGGIKGNRIDLFTGASAASMRFLSALNLHTLTVSKVGAFSGCPPTSGAGMRLASAG